LYPSVQVNTSTYGMVFKMIGVNSCWALGTHFLRDSKVEQHFGINTSGSS